MAAFAFALPGPTACVLIGAAEFQPLPDGSVADATSTASENEKYQELTRQAKARIEATFGVPVAKPILVFLNDTQRVGPFKLNSHGSTQFVGSRACVMVGPKGRNVDVIAHELMHVELHHRVGYWQRFRQIPTWFDEGVAMQVDYRARYTLPEDEKPKTGYVRELGTVREFFEPNEQAVVRNYAAAKAIVADWIAEVGAGSLYTRFERIRQGSAFTEVLAK
jgi:hypothetical protein